MLINAHQCTSVSGKNTTLMLMMMNRRVATGAAPPPMVVMHVTLRCGTVRYIHEPNGLHYCYYYMLTD